MNSVDGNDSFVIVIQIDDVSLEIYPLYNVKRSLIGLLNNLPKRLVTFSPEVDLNDSALLDSTSFRKKFCKGTEKDWLVFRTEENVELRSLDLELLRSLRNVTFFFEYEKHHLRP